MRKYWPKPDSTGTSVLGVGEVMALVELHEKMRQAIGKRAYFALYDLLLALNNVDALVQNIHAASDEPRSYERIASTSRMLLGHLRDFHDEFQRPRPPRKKQQPSKGIPS